MIWLCVDWADVQVTLFGNDEAFASVGKESSLITASHLGDFDWLIGLMFADGHGFIEVKYKRITERACMCCLLLLLLLIYLFCGGGV